MHPTASQRLTEFILVYWLGLGVAFFMTTSALESSNASHRQGIQGAKNYCHVQQKKNKQDKNVMCVRSGIQWLTDMIMRLYTFFIPGGISSRSTCI